MKKTKLTLFIGLMLLTVLVYGQGKAYQMRYNSPASNYLPDDPRKKVQPVGYIQEALQLGNGRLGAMFGGGIGNEHLVVNEISAWMNTVRGRDEVSQSGVRMGSSNNLDKLREATQNEQYGTDENSIESLATRYFSSHTRLGNYAPFTDVFISTGHDSAKVEDYQRALDLRTGLGTVSYKIGESKYTREYFCSYPNDLLVVKYTSDGEALNLKINTSTKHKTNITTGFINRVTLCGEIPMVRDNMEFMQIIHVVVNKGGVGTSSDGIVSVRNADEVTIYIAGYTDYLPNYPTFKGRDYEQDCENTISNAVALGYDVVKEKHIADVTGLIDRCKFDLEFEPSGLSTDKLVEKGESVELENLYFNFARYLQTACSRGTAVPSNLQGIWNSYENPMWNCDYHNDINIAMNYWMVETANLPEMFSPYLEWMKIIAESGKHTAKEAFGAERGWSTGLNSNVFGFTAQNEHGRRMQHSGAWLAQNLYDHFSFSRDKNELEEIYPIIKGAAEFFLEFLAPWKDGTLVVYPTWSPENYFLGDEHSELNKQAWGAQYDQQLIYNLFVDCIEASQLLDKDEAFRQEIMETIPKLCPQKVGKRGQLQEWPEDFDGDDTGHRHLSHLIALHPGRDISPFTNEELAEAAQTTLIERCERPQGGWASAWRIAMWARMFDGNQAHSFYRTLTTDRTSPNLFNGGTSHFQVDGNFGGPAGVCEMLLQSHLRSIDNKAQSIDKAAFNAYEKDLAVANNFSPVVPDDKLAHAPYIIHLLPALPDAWPNGNITGLRARGGFEVDMAWESGKLEQATIHAVAGGSFRIYSNGSLSKVISLNKGESMVWTDN
jgi:alpha-L-fucosidase 2